MYVASRSLNVARRLRSAAGAVLVLLTLFRGIAMSNPREIAYTLGMPRPSTHLFHVEVRVHGPDPLPPLIHLVLPVWRTGRYVVMDFAGGVVSFQSTDDAGAALAWRKKDKTTWEIETRGATSVTVHYALFANEFHLRTRGLNDERAFVDGAAVFMYVEQFRSLPITLTVVPYDSWHVTTGLDAVPGKPLVFSAPNYDHLADCPLEIGTQTDFMFEIEGKPHILSISGNGNYDAQRLIADMTTIVREHSKFWGGLPYNRYVFLLSLSAKGRGGTEHFNSCVLNADPFAFKNPERYDNFLSLVSHEFFHTWNVKRLRPAGLQPYDWTRENYVEELWFAEGTTSYYDDLLLVRAGLLSEQEYLKKIATMIERDLTRPGNRRQSLAASSYDAWIKFWKDTHQANNFETDYYARGAAVSFVLDMTLRAQTKNRRSLDDVMKTLYVRFPYGVKGYTNEDVRAVCEELAGTDFTRFFRSYVMGTDSIRWQDALTVVGLEMEEQPTDAKPWLGITGSADGRIVRIEKIVEGSPAYDAGLDEDDEIVALNGYRVRSAGELDARLAEMSEGEKVRLTIFRDDRLREFDVVLGRRPFPAFRVVRVKKPTPAQQSAYRSWLARTAESGTKR